ncbi:N-acetylmuramoyl-L-alanine amidase [Carnobacterium divergens]|uniref:N-acetylmuramoyl-L-alanine amidase n=1 Tax=Carnobacterium divergens TaxID=2748 RepID=UPI00289153F4|nr:N-acetylmuramoyl-L-alanine amidase [Carnobacterium divergens]MDT2011816.1 Ig-like domain-containing protein [Carnobacterium divergens]
MKNKKITLSIVFVILMSVLFPSLSTVVYATETKVNDLTTEQSAGIDNNNSSKKIDNELSEKESLEPNTEEVQTNQSTEINKEALKSQDDLRNETMSDVMKKAASIPSFIEEISGAASNLANSNDLYSSVMIAQAILESKYGTSELGSSPVHNLFGIKGTYNGQYVMKDTLEVINGETVTVNAQFRKYPSYTESLQDYVNKLKLGPGSENGSSWSPNYYSGAWKSNTQSYKDATKFLTGKYASDLNYNTKLDSLIQTYQLTRFDNPGTAKIISNLETPEPDTIINEDKIFVKGWALSTDSVKDVSVSLNGKSIGTAEYGKNRPDVYNAYPQYNNQSAGYEYNINSENMVAGTNKLKVTVSTDSGQTSETTSTISVPNDLVVVDPNLPNILTVDTLTNGTILKDNMIIKGWGLSASQVKKVEMLVDGKAIGEAQLGIERLDVEHFYPQYKNKNSGYSYQLDLSQVSEGKHVFTVKMTTGNGQVVENKYNVEKPKVDILSSIDSPQRNESISGIYKIRGWAIASEKISTVKVAVDGKEMGVATYGLQRDDVYHAYPSFNQKNGGYEYQLDTSTLTGGNHELEVITTTISGKTSTYKITIKIPVLSNILTVDTLVNGTILKDGYIIKGWGLSQNGVKKVEMLVDGKAIGEAQLGIERLDVEHFYPQYKNKNSGYSYQLDIGKVSEGKHVFTVKMTTGDGKIIENKYNVEKPKVDILSSIDTPQRNETISGTYKITGWAIASEKVSTVKVAIDGKEMGVATYGLQREDVYHAYPSLNQKNGGYEYLLDTSKLTVGDHKLEVITTTASGKISTYQISIKIPGLTNILTVDTLTNGTILKDNMIIKGWGLSASQVKKVEMLVDGKAIGEAQLGIERLDVEHFYPQYKNKNSGYSYQLDIGKVSEGKHVFTVKMTTGNGQVVENKYNVEKPKVDILSSIDSPQRNESISGIYKIRGWAIANEKISTVKVAIDGKEMGVATYGLQRDDVYHAYPSFNQKNGGYEYQLDTSRLTGGDHKLEVITTTVSGKTATYRIDMKISILDYRSQLDTPKSGGYISKNQLIKGWVLNKSEVKSISASINDNFVGNATVKLSRPDVGNAYPEYNNANSGFELKLTNANLKAGLNTLKLKITFMDGSEKIISTTATYSENLLPITGSIDEPSANQANNSNDMLVRGWFLAEEGIDQVDVYVDNVYQGKANYGQLRTDVSNAYPQYKNANSGYNLSVSTKGLSAGKHTVKVIATSNVSGTKTYEQSFLRGGLAGRKVFVDPGHGGTDPGAVSGGVQEKDLNLSVSLKLQALLESKGAEVIMSRTGDQFIPLSTISSKANASNADIFVSVHTNSAVASASGIETYSYSGTSRSVGMFSLDLDKQNESLSEGGFSTFGIDRLTKSVKLSEFVQKSMINSTGAVDRGAKKQDFHVIRETNMPAILTEIGFVTNPSERAKLVSDWYQNQLATGIFNGVDNYFKTN